MKNLLLPLVLLVIISGCVSTLQSSESTTTTLNTTTITTIQEVYQKSTKIVMEAHPYYLEVSETSLRSLYGDKILNETIIGKENFSVIENLVLSDTFKSLQNEYKSNLPQGSACTQASTKVIAYYKDGQNKSVDVEGCRNGTGPSIIDDIYGKIMSLYYSKISN